MAPTQFECLFVRPNSEMSVCASEFRIVCLCVRISKCLFVRPNHLFVRPNTSLQTVSTFESERSEAREARPPAGPRVGRRSRPSTWVIINYMLILTFESNVTIVILNPPPITYSARTKLSRAIEISMQDDSITETSSENVLGIKRWDRNWLPK